MVPSDTITLTLKLPGSGGLDAAPPACSNSGSSPQPGSILLASKGGNKSVDYRYVSISGHRRM
jgi:hypothetical protein